MTRTPALRLSALRANSPHEQLFESLAGRYDLVRHDTRGKRDDIAGGRFRQSAGGGADNATPF
jgi:hypothetical protein